VPCRSRELQFPQIYEVSQCFFESLQRTPALIFDAIAANMFAHRGSDGIDKGVTASTVSATYRCGNAQKLILSMPSLISSMRRTPLYTMRKPAGSSRDGIKHFRTNLWN
jgi:hypothetical protein